MSSTYRHRHHCSLLLTCISAGRSPTAYSFLLTPYSLQCVSIFVYLNLMPLLFSPSCSRISSGPSTAYSFLPVYYTYTRFVSVCLHLTPLPSPSLRSVMFPRIFSMCNFSPTSTYSFLPTTYTNTHFFSISVYLNLTPFLYHRHFIHFLLMYTSTDSPIAYTCLPTSYTHTHFYCLHINPSTIYISSITAISVLSFLRTRDLFFFACRQHLSCIHFRLYPYTHSPLHLLQPPNAYQHL